MLIPPIKCQGIKWRLADWLVSHFPRNMSGWYREPFMGSGAVAFHFAPERALLSDRNPHLIRFYQHLQSGNLTPMAASDHLAREGEKLLATDGEHYYAVRDRFRSEANPLDFLFLSRSCFNGLMRFNRKGEFNTPFCRKPARFSKAYVTKIRHQIEHVVALLSARPQWEFREESFSQCLLEASANDFVYCDPPYLGRNTNYFDSWTEQQEADLAQGLVATPARFALSTWHSNKFRQNPTLLTHWSPFRQETRSHQYFVGAQEVNRHPVTEALILNY